MTTPHETHVSLVDLVVQFPGTTAVDGATLDIAPGEFFSLLGPSGCGKTTLLRTIAGFYRQRQGGIWFGDTRMDAVPAHKRDTGMVFQNYALFPHLTVAQNVAYGLKPRRVPRAEADERVRQALALVDLTGLEDRKPRQLSGGQQQRVAVARAVVIRPRVLLMDEPLANLDAKLRVRLRTDLRTLQKRLGITTIYVTHDQDEALSLSDRIAVMFGGRIEQVGTPEEIYERPANRRVAEFVGEGNFLPATVRAVAGAAAKVEVAGVGSLEAEAREDARPGRAVVVGFRPHDVTLAPLPAGGAGGGLVGTLLSRTYLGDVVRYELELANGATVIAESYASAGPPGQVGERFALGVAPGRARLFAAEAGGAAPSAPETAPVRRAGADSALAGAS